MVVKIDRNIRSNFAGYNVLINLFHKINEHSGEDIHLDFTENYWFEGNLSAILGAIRFFVEEQGKSIKFNNLSPILDDVLHRNDFFSQYGRDPKIDAKASVISFKKFTKDEHVEFMTYLKNELLSKSDFPKHSQMLGKRIIENIFELFENARTHGNCKYIYTCGQHYPNQKKNRLDITIVDLGSTIKRNVNEYQNTNLSGSETIEWAMKLGNTTKTGDTPGGFGLGILFEFIKLNLGKIQIASADGYWEFKKENIEKGLFECSFPGTIVNIEFNLNDTNSYKLSKEISLDGLF